MTSTIKVTHVIGQLAIGGGERQLWELIVNSDPEKTGHKVIYYEEGNDEEGRKLFCESGIETHRIYRNRHNPFGFILSLRNKIIETEPDIVHCWLYSANIYGRWAAVLAGCRNVIVAYRSCGLKRAAILKVNESLTSGRVHHLANSRACAKTIAEKLGVDPGKFDVIYNGVDLKKITNAVPAINLKEQLAISKENKLVCMVGRLTAAKNYPMLLRTAKRCKEEELKLHFIIAGHGEKEQELKSLSAEMNLEDTVSFLGLRNDVPNLLKSSNFFLYTSLWEGFPNALLEAMAAGLPIVTNDFDGAKELINPDENGTIVNIDDDESACEALQKYINEPDYASMLAKTAHRDAYNNFSLNSMVDNYLNYYQKLAKISKSRHSEL